MENLESGYRSVDGHLYVHLIPHSHDDVGWLKTPDEYYSGTNQNIQNANVSRIITSVVEELKTNPERRFA